MTSLQDRALLPKRQVLHEQNLLAAKESSERAEAERKQADYGLPELCQILRGETVVMLLISVPARILARDSRNGRKFASGLPE
jgi:hypothetical protein